MAELNQDAANQIMQGALKKWRPDLIRALESAASRRKIKNTGELINSIAATVVNGDSKSFGKLLLYFESYGRFSDQKIIEYSTTTGPPVESLVEWVKKRGLTSFKTVPSYKGSRSFLTEDQNAKRIAWGIVFHRRSAQFKHKRKIWFNKTFMHSYNDLQDALMKEYLDFVADGMVATFN